MKQKSKMIILPCDCKCCMFVVEKTIWKDGDISFDLSIQDSRYDHNYNTIWGRLKRAAKTLFGKPIYYNNVHLEGESTIRKFIEDMSKLADSDLNEDDSSFA